MASQGLRHFVDWEEQFISHDRGSRVVHYYLRDRHGQSSLAVVGTERSLRHMVYVVCDDFLPLAGLDKTTTSAFKWRARREVVEWLQTLLSKTRSASSEQFLNSGIWFRPCRLSNLDRFQRRPLHKSKVWDWLQFMSCFHVQMFLMYFHIIYWFFYTSASANVLIFLGIQGLQARNQHLLKSMLWWRTLMKPWKVVRKKEVAATLYVNSPVSGHCSSTRILLFSSTFFSLGGGRGTFAFVDLFH